MNLIRRIFSDDTTPAEAAQGDPFAASRKAQALKDIATIGKLKARLNTLELLNIDTAIDGRPHGQGATSVQLDVCELFASLFEIDEGNLLHDHVRTLRFELGLAAE